MFVVQRMCKGEGTEDKFRRGKITGNFIAYVEDYFQLTPPDKQKGIREMHQYFKKQTYNRQTTSHQYSFCEISEHSNCLASTIDFKCNREKQDIGPKPGQ